MSDGPGPVAGVEVDQDLIALVGRYVEGVKDPVLLRRFGELVAAEVETRRIRLEDLEFESMLATARRFGVKLDEWVTRRMGGSPAVAGPSTAPETGSPSGREFTAGFNFDCRTGQWGLMVGPKPGFVAERIKEGYRPEQLVRPAGTFEETRGWPYWVDEKGGWYQLRTRSGMPPRIRRLRDAGHPVESYTRPPGSFAGRPPKGHIDRRDLPVRYDEMVRLVGEVVNGTEGFVERYRTALDPQKAGSKVETVAELHDEILRAADVPGGDILSGTVRGIIDGLMDSPGS